MTSPGASYSRPFHPRSMTRPCRPSAPSSTLGDPAILSTLPLRAEPTRPSTQRGGGCFCNLATLSIFSIHSVPHQGDPSVSLSPRSTVFHLESSSRTPFGFLSLAASPFPPSHALSPLSYGVLCSLTSSRLFHPVAVSFPPRRPVLFFLSPSLAGRYKQGFCACVDRVRRLRLDQQTGTRETLVARVLGQLLQDTLRCRVARRDCE